MLFRTEFILLYVQRCVLPADQIRAIKKFKVSVQVNHQHTLPLHPKVVDIYY